MENKENGMKTSGIEVRHIPNMRFISLSTPYAEKIVDGLERSCVLYSAKYNDQKLTLVYAFEDQENVDFILKRVKSKNVELIERFRKHGSSEDYAELMPEIADVMGISVSTLESRPAELKMNLAETYVDYWFCDKFTIFMQLARITELGYKTKEMMETESARQQRKAENDSSEKRVIFNREMLIQEAEHIRQQSRNAALQNEKEQTAYEKR